MPNRNKSAKQRLREFLDARQPAAVTEAVWQELLRTLAPISESYLRGLLRAAGIPIDQPYGGIRQHTFDELEASLVEMLVVYRTAQAAGDRERAHYARRQVIGAKDRARYLAKKQEHKREMVEWMLVWLENPEVFPPWVEARKRAMEAPPSG